MGREIVIQARVNNNVIYEDYVCGRDSATEYIASLVSNYCNEHNLDTCEMVLSYNNKRCIADSNKTLTQIIERLSEYEQQDTKEINKAKACLEDLKYARRNAQTLEAFEEFTEKYESVEQWIEENDFSRAKNLVDMLNTAVSKLNDYGDPLTKRLVIIWSE